MGQGLAHRISSAIGMVAGLLIALSVPACCSISRIVTESLPDATLGQQYSFSLQHNCSDKTTTDSASWELQEGELPPGIGLSREGRLTGTATAAGTFSFRVFLSGWGGTYYSGSDSRTLTLTVRR